jgi:hypothetical protein
MAGVAKLPGHRQSNSHIVALLSLKVLLLAFFILLNSLASFEEERSAAVADSVREAFRGVVPAERSLTSDDAGVDIFDGAEQVVEALAQLFDAQLPLVEEDEGAGTWTLKVDLPASDLFDEQSQDLTPDGEEVLRMIATVLEDPRFAQSGYRVDVLYGIGGNDSGIQGNGAALGRAGVLIRQLEQQGLSPARLSTGFLPSFPGQVRFLFTVELPVPPGGALQGAGN